MVDIQTASSTLIFSPERIQIPYFLNVKFLEVCDLMFLDGLVFLVHFVITVPSMHENKFHGLILSNNDS